MNSEQKKSLNVLCNSVEDSLTIVFISVGDEISRIIGEALEEIVESSSCLQLKKKKDSDQDEPHIQIRGNIRFKARPYEKLFDMFLSLIDSARHFDSGQPAKHLGIENLIAPVFLKVYVAPFCPYCAKVVEEMVTLALTSELIHVDIIDGSLFDQKARADRVMAAPTVICDDKHRWSGQVTALEILDIILSRKPEELSPATLRSMVEAGNAYSLAGMMVRENKVFPAIYALLTSDKWPVRLGAMVTVQAMYELQPELSETIIENLWRGFDDFSESVQGDVVYLIGEVASKPYQQKLKGLLKSDLSNDLRESVDDALEIIRNR